MTANAVPVAGTYPLHFNKREAKVIETCLSASGTLTGKTVTSSTLDVTNTFQVYDSLFTMLDNTQGLTTPKTLAWQLSGMTANKTFTQSFVSDVNSTLKFDLTGSTTAKTLSLAAAVTDDRIVSFPDGNYTVAGLSLANVFSGANVLYDTVTIANSTTSPKAIGFSTSGATASTKITLAAAQASNITVNLPTSAGTIALTSDIGTDVLASATVSVSVADMNGAYATPKQIIAAPGASSYIKVESFTILHTYGSAAFAAGGATYLQYDSTIHGAGTAISADLASTITEGSSTNKTYGVTSAAGIDAVAQTNKGVFLSNQTQAYTTGTGGSFKIRISYRVMTVLA